MPKMLANPRHRRLVEEVRYGKCLNVTITSRVGADKRGGTMAGLDALQSVQYITIKGERFALINANDCWIESVEDVKIAKEAFVRR